MSRDATAGVLTSFEQPVLRPIIFVELDYPSGFVRVNSADRTFSFDSGSGVVDFLGVGQLGSISAVGETTELQASKMSFTLTGIPQSSISAAFEKAQGRRAKMWLGSLDSSYAIIADPVLLFVGLIDNSTIDIGVIGTVTVNVNNRFIEWQREKIRRYTDADQQAEFPGDKFFQYIVQAVEKEIIWGPGGPEPVNAVPAPSSSGFGERSNAVSGPERPPASEPIGPERR